MQRKFFFSRNILVVVVAIFITLLVGVSRINLMLRLESSGFVDFNQMDYFLRIAYIFLVSIVFLVANTFFNKIELGPFKLDLFKPNGIIIINLLIFIPLQALNFFITTQQVGPIQDRFFIDSGPVFTLWPVMSNLSLMFVTVLIGTTYRYMKENYQISINNEALKRETAQARFANLKEQLNPHFLFNSFSTLNGLIDEAPVKAKKFLHNMSDVYRYVLNTEKQDTVLLGEEIEYTNLYIEMIKERFEDSVNIKFDIKPDSMHSRVLPLSIQMLIENAVKHNRFDEDHPLYIEIKANDSSLEVVNNLNPRNVEDSHFLGLHNLNQRYRYLSNREIIIKETSQSFKVIIPLLE